MGTFWAAPIDKDAYASIMDEGRCAKLDGQGALSRPHVRCGPDTRIQPGEMAELGRADTHVALEQKRKMALIGKAADQRNFVQGRVGMSQQVGGVLNPAFSNQLPYGAAVVLVELAREMNIVNAHFGGDVGQAVR